MKSTRIKITMILEKTKTGFSAYAEEYPIYTTAGSVPELLENAYEAAILYFEDQDVIIEKNNIQFDIDFKQFFKYYRVLNSKFLAERIGMHPSLLSQYIQGQKKPSNKQRDKILLGIRQVGRELSQLNFTN